MTTLLGTAVSPQFVLWIKPGREKSSCIEILLNKLEYRMMYLNIWGYSPIMKADTSRSKLSITLKGQKALQYFVTPLCSRVQSCRVMWGKRRLAICSSRGLVSLERGQKPNINFCQHYSSGIYHGMRSGIHKTDLTVVYHLSGMTGGIEESLIS